jgi:Bacterial Ig-like domain
VIAVSAILARRGVFGPRALRYLLAPILVLSLICPTSVRATTDIPGVAWAGGSVSGEVGGPIVDLVYAVDIPAGSVVVATVSGARGAELGLYLFLSGAESILIDEPLVSSARPGGLQRISAVVRTPGRYYLNVNGRNADRAYAFTLSLLVKQDTSAAEYVSVSPETSSRSRDVCVNVSARDSVSGISRVALRDSTTDAPLQWVPYERAGRFCTSVAEGDGDRQLSVFVENGVGLVKSVKARVTIDDTLPRVLLATPAQGSVTVRERPTLAWTFSEPIRLAGTAEDSMFATNQLGEVIRGILAISSDRTIVTWRPTNPIRAGSVLIANLVGVLDDAENSSNPIDSLEVFVKRATTIRASVRQRFDGELTIGYLISRNLINDPLIVEGLTDTGWAQIQSVVPRATAGSVRVRPGEALKLRIRWPGSDNLAPATSNRLQP